MVVINMDKKSLINIYDSNGNAITMEVIFSFKIIDINYIVYRELDSDKMYAAKFINDINEDFDSNLSSQELELVNNMYKEVLNDNK